MFKTILKNFLWVTPVGLMMVSGGQATAATILLDDFDSLQGTSNKELSREGSHWNYLGKND